VNIINYNSKIETASSETGCNKVSYQAIIMKCLDFCIIDLHSNFEVIFVHPNLVLICKKWQWTQEGEENTGQLLLCQSWWVDNFTSD